MLNIVLGAVAELLAGLEKKLYLAALYLVLALGKDLCRAEEHCHVVVMAAGVHNAVVLRGERKAGFFLNGQCVNIGTEHESAAGSAGVKRSDKAGVVRHKILNLVSESLDILDKGLGRLPLLKAQLRVCMEMPSALDYIRVVFFGQCLYIHKKPPISKFCKTKKTAGQYMSCRLS